MGHILKFVLQPTGEQWVERLFPDPWLGLG